jgi:hypothetical protein
MPFSFRSTVSRFSIALVLSLTTLSCEQFEHSSPLPGILEVRLGVINNRQDLLPYTAAGFFLRLKSLEANQPGGIKLPIFSDLSAIRRNPDGDEFNSLDAQARDSSLILGQVYAPPEPFTRLELTISPEQFVFISQGFFGSTIPVIEIPPVQALQRLPKDPGQQLNINVQESRLTVVTVTLNLDSALVQRTETFGYRPYFYVSSVQTF